MVRKIKFSVLMSLYYKENPLFLEESLESIINQSLLPNEIVIIKDGELTKELDSVINKYSKQYSKLINVISLDENQGLGKALSIGIKKCKYDLIARMDSDDISKKNRFERQIKIFENNYEIDIVGSWVEEFEGNKNNIVSKRKVPKTNKEILNFAKFRNPFNHPTVMLKKQAVLKANNYKDFYLNEDYYLWLRMLKKGFKAYNIQESLLYFRVNKDTFKRRGGLKYAVQDIRLQNKILELGFINKFEYLKNIFTRPVSRILPNFLREYIYKNFLR